MMASEANLLSVEHLSVGYGPRLVLEDISFHVAKGECVALVGANGAGKTTLMRALLGTLRPHLGAIGFDGHTVTASAPAARVRAGMSLSPEGRLVCADLSVADNICLGAYPLRLSRATMRVRLEDMLSLFEPLRPRLRQPAGVLSGGEQQMVAMARALMAEPKLLLLDEPTLGLSPAMVDRIFGIVRSLHARGVAVLMAEQQAGAALSAAQTGYVLAAGCIVQQGPAAQLLADPAVQRAFLGDA